MSAGDLLLLVPKPQGVCQNSLKVDDGGTGAAAFEGAKT
jgi:hypothetical protein